MIEQFTRDCEVLRLFAQLPADHQQLLINVLRLPRRERLSFFKVATGQRSIPEGLTPVIVHEHSRFWFVDNDRLRALCEEGYCTDVSPLMYGADSGAPPLYDYRPIGDEPEGSS